MAKLSNEKGFTLIELSIVLVIIGIILGAVLKGQELINNAKMKRAASQQKEIVAAIYTYYDRYSRFPGDDNTVTGRTGFAGLYAAGNGNGQINGTLAQATACPTVSPGATDACGLWEHLRAANLITGSGPTNPGNAYGGVMGVGYFAIQGLTTNWVVLTNISPDVAQIIDTQFDDGVYNTGSIRASAVYTGAVPLTLGFRL